MLSPEVERGAQVLLHDLLTSALEVTLVPAPRPTHHGHMVRVATGCNPDWYRRLCARHPSSRHRHSTKADTRLRRAHIVAVLMRLSRGQTSRSPYAPELMALALAHAADPQPAGDPPPPPCTDPPDPEAMDALPW